MRSSIACARCRRSKVKCVNNGVGTICRACETSGRECTYPVPAVTGSGGNRRGSGEGKQLGEGLTQNDVPKRSRAKKLATPSSNSTKESTRALVDALDSTLLTPQVWLELFDIWQLHFSADLPFIHAPTFLQPLRQMQQTPRSGDFAVQREITNSLPPASPLILLAFLSLTARFHERIVSHHSPPSASRPSNPLTACAYYAAAAKARLAGNSGAGLGVPTTDQVQGLAMLALHDWGNCAGQKSWIELGVSIRYSQLLGIQYQGDLDDEPHSRSRKIPHHLPFMGLLSQSTVPNGNQDFIGEEIQRRTFWGLFILDRYLSSGKYRPQMINVSDIRLQLPCSERSFLFAERVRTALLSDKFGEVETRLPIHRFAKSSARPCMNGDAKSSLNYGDAQMTDDDERLGRWETGPLEGIVSRYVRAIDLFGCIIRWSCGGGRRREKQPPWDGTSPWNVMNQKLDLFIDRLPRDLTLSAANIQAHITSGTSTPFVLLHAVLLLSRMMLHREYVPFLPLRCSQPEGPLDPPLFPPEQYHVPQNFWTSSAAALFKSARQLVDLVQTSREWNVFPQTPIVGFAVYIAGLIGVYSINFPWMDQNGYMCKRQQGNGLPEDDSGSNASRQALSLIAFMRPRLKMADGWFKTINRIHRYDVRVKKDFHRNMKAFGGHSQGPGPLGIREGGAGGGLEEFKLIAATLQEFGSLDDEIEMADAPDADASKAYSSADAASTGAKSEGPAFPDDNAGRYDRWNAINTFAGNNIYGGTALTTNGSYPPGITSSTTSPSTSGALYQNQPSAQNSPMISPACNKLPPHLPQYAGGQLSQPVASPQYPAQIQSPPMTPDQAAAWLRGLNTTFGGDDLNAFVEGTEWQSWDLEPDGSNSWLSTVWSTGPVS